MPSLRREEQVAAATLAATLGLRVEPHDDGSRPSMYDLKIVVDAEIVAAVEVTAAADENSIELHRVVNDHRDRWIEPTLRGGWALQLQPTAWAKRLRQELPTFLRELEEQGVTEIAHVWWGPYSPGSVESRAHRLGIVSGNQSGTDFLGSIYLAIEQPFERTGGQIDDSSAAVGPWVREFLVHPKRRDLLGKLERSGASERHAFIVVPAFSAAPLEVVDMLWRDLDDVVPAGGLNLPEQVTHVWLMTLWIQGSGLRWSPDEGWTRFERQFPNPGSL